MGLRSQAAGKQKLWTLNELKEGFESFHKTHGRYPTTPEIDAYPYLPSSKTLERRFGGALGLRKTLGLDGQHDYRLGKHSSTRAKVINTRAAKIESEVYEFLTGKFGKEFVHREYLFMDDRRTRADFFVYDRKNGFCVDVFYPKDRRNLIGCLNSKLQKYHTEYMRQYPVIFLQMNEGLSQGELDEMLARKKKKLLAGEYLMSWDAFKAFCSSRNALKLAGRGVEKKTTPA